ncbi:Hook [Acrasis kona]|uniref:Hook n=1 Tax=Acrasis kona TaxID=1008807 RepID=A0AAW2ZI46_9EUKA
MNVHSEDEVEYPSTPGSSYKGPIRKKELLQWASTISSVPCTKLEDLRSGVVFLKIMSRIWPKVVDLKRLKYKSNPKTERDVSANWDLIKFVMIELKLPMEVYDRKAIILAKFKQCYTFLVMLYFLQSLSEKHDFSVDFAHPIDGKLAAFLQSKASVECLARGGGLHMEEISNEEDSGEDDQVLSTPIAPQHSHLRNIPEPTPPPLPPSSSSMDSVRKFIGSLVSPKKAVKRELLEFDEEYEVESNKSILSSQASQDNWSDAIKTDISQDLDITPKKLKALTPKKVNEAEGPITWKNEENKTKGELMLTKMSLSRQLSATKKEKDYILKRSFQQISELKVAHENELLYQRDSHRTAVAAQQMILLSDRSKDQFSFDLELKKIHDELAFESDRIRQSGLSLDPIELEDEILRLREVRLLQTRQIKSLESANENLRDLNEKTQGELNNEQEKNKALHEYYRSQNTELLEFENLDGMTDRERFMAVRIRNLQDELAELQSKFESDVEAAKLEAHRSQNSNMENFDAEQKIERLECEVARLRRVNMFLRERAVILGNNHNNSKEQQLNNISVESINEENGTDIIWTPSHVVSDASAEVFTLLRQLKKTDPLEESSLSLKEKDLLTKLEKCFWQLVSDQTKLQHRVKRSKSSITNLHNQHTAARKDFNTSKAEQEQRVEQLEMAHRLEVEQIKSALTSDRGSLLVRIALTEENLNDVREELREHFARMDEKEDKSNSMRSRLRAIQEEARLLRLREKLWTHLIETQRKNLQITEQLTIEDDYEKIVTINDMKEKLDMDATGYVEQLQVLMKMPVDIDDTDLIKEATQHLRDQLASMSTRLLDMSKARELDIDKLRNLEIEKKELNFEIEREKSMRDSILKELDVALNQKNNAKQMLQEKKDLEDEAILKLRKQIEDLTCSIEEANVDKSIPESNF